MIGIIDCNIGNFGSLLNAFSYLGAQAQVIADSSQVDQQSAIVLPGVGAFDTAMDALNSSGFGRAVEAYANSGRPVLGICLGMQVLCNGSTEGSAAGLGLIDGDVVNFRSLGCMGKVPHVGFNSIRRVDGASPWLTGTEGYDYYFVHSFALKQAAGDVAVAIAEYGGIEFVAALQRENIFATQFHPEKSGEAGLALLRKFLLCLKNA